QTTGTGNITVTADSMSLSTANAIDGANDVTIQPYTSGTSVGVGSSATCGGSCGLLLNDTTLGDIAYGSATIRDNTKTGVMDINTGYTFPNAPVAFETGQGAITINAALASNAASGNTVTFSSSGEIVANGGVTTQGGNVTLDSDYSLGGGAIVMNSGSG